MKKLFILVLFPLITACGITNHKVGQVALFSTVKQTPENIQVVTTEKVGTKEGKACATNILNIFATGDMRIETAKKNGNISTITSVSEEITNMFFKSTVCTIVKGY